PHDDADRSRDLPLRLPVDPQVRRPRPLEHRQLEPLRPRQPLRHPRRHRPAYLRHPRLLPGLALSEQQMRNLTEASFVSLDGVADDPRAWAMSYFDEQASRSLAKRCRQATACSWGAARTNTSRAWRSRADRTPTRSTTSENTSSRQPSS